MGGIGSGRKPKNKEKKVKINLVKNGVPVNTITYSVPAHVEEIRLSGACRFRG